MNRSTIAVIAAAAVAVAAAGAWFYIDHRAKSEVEAAFVGLRAQGATATYGQVAFNPFGMALTISDISIANADSSAVRIAKVVAGGIDPTAKTFKAKTVVATGVTAKMPGAKPADAKSAEMPSETTVKLETVTARDVRIGELSAADPKSTGSSSSVAKVGGSSTDGDLAPIARVIQALDIGAVSMQGLGVDIGNPSQGVGAAYKNVEAGEVRDGKIGKLTISSGEIAVRGAQKASGTVGAIETSAIDIVTLLGVDNPKRTIQDGYALLQGPTQVGPSNFKTADGVEFSLEAFVADASLARPTFSMAKYYKGVFASMPRDGREPTPAQLVGAMDEIASFYDDMALGNAEVRGMKFAVPGKGPAAAKIEGRMALFRMNGLKNGRLEEYALEGLKLEGGPTPVDVGRVAIRGLALSEFMRLAGKQAAAGPGKPPTEFVARLPAMLEGVDVRKIDVADPRSGGVTRVEEINASWGKVVDGIPTVAKLAGSIELPLDPRDPSHAALKQKGFKALPLKLDVDAGWVEASKVLTVTPKRIELSGLGAVTGEVVLGNVPREAIGLAQAPMLAAMPDFEIVKFDVDVTDLGAMAVNEAERAAVGMQLAATKQKLAAAGLSAVNFTALSNALEQFSGATGKTISIRFAPKARTTVGDLLTSMGSEAGFASLLDASDFSATVK